jgi:hypothetical protein
LFTSLSICLLLVHSRLPLAPQQNIMLNATNTAGSTCTYAGFARVVGAGSNDRCPKILDPSVNATALRIALNTTVLPAQYFISSNCSEQILLCQDAPLSNSTICNEHLPMMSVFVNSGRLAAGVANLDGYLPAVVR